MVGSGNLVGIATALVCGLSSALFWMVIAALIGMSIKYVEIVLGIRQEMKVGSFEGGTMYYLAKGLKQLMRECNASLIFAWYVVTNRLVRICELLWLCS